MASFVKNAFGTGKKNKQDDPNLADEPEDSTDLPTAPLPKTEPFGAEQKQENPPPATAAPAPPSAPPPGKPKDVPVGAVTLRVPKTSVRAEVVTELGLVMNADGTVSSDVRLDTFSAQMSKVLEKISKKEVVKMVLESNSTQDMWRNILKFLQANGSLDLVGICSAALLLPPNKREMIYSHLSGIEALQNRSGRLQKSLVILAGHLGLATCKGDPMVDHMTVNIPNPLLGEPAQAFRPGRLQGKTDAEQKSAIEKAKEGHVRYTEVHNEMMKRFQPQFAKMDRNLALQISATVKLWLGAV